MKENEYDLVFSIGYACACSIGLRDAGLQYSSFPFDWLYGADLRTRADVVKDGFRHWLDEEDLELVEVPQDYCFSVYRNRKTGISFNHDFARGRPLSETLPEVREKYQRRIARLFGHFRAGCRIKIVWVNIPGKPVTTEADMAYCLEVFRAKFPGVQFDLLALDCDESVPADRPSALHGDGFVRLSFNYRKLGVDEPRFAMRHDLIAGALRGFRARDYRTPEEIAAYQRAKRLKKYARYGASTLPGYLFKKVFRWARG